MALNNQDENKDPRNSISARSMNAMGIRKQVNIYLQYSNIYTPSLPYGVTSKDLIPKLNPVTQT